MKKTLLVLLVLVLQVAVADDRPAGKGEEVLRQATDRFMTRISDKQIAEDEFKLVGYNMGDAVGDDLKTFTITEPAR
jgi:hypothetical protein